jgi:hypothetical protein
VNGTDPTTARTTVTLAVRLADDARSLARALTTVAGRGHRLAGLDVRPIGDGSALAVLELVADEPAARRFALQLARQVTIHHVEVVTPGHATARPLVDRVRVEVRGDVRDGWDPHHEAVVTLAAGWGTGPRVGAGDGRTRELALARAVSAAAGAAGDAEIHAVVPLPDDAGVLVHVGRGERVRTEVGTGPSWVEAVAMGVASALLKLAPESSLTARS